MTERGFGGGGVARDGYLYSQIHVCTTRGRFMEKATGVDGGIKSGLVLRAYGRYFLLCLISSASSIYISLSLYLSIFLCPHRHLSPTSLPFSRRVSLGLHAL